MPLPVRRFRLPQGRAADAALAAGAGVLVALSSLHAFVGDRREPWRRRRWGGC